MKESFASKKKRKKNETREILFLNNFLAIFKVKFKHFSDNLNKFEFFFKLKIYNWKHKHKDERKLTGIS